MHIALTRTRVTLAGLVVLAAVAGCSNAAEPDAPSADADTSAQAAADAEGRLTDNVTLPTKIGITDPLTKAPTGSRTVYWIAPNIEVIQAQTEGFKDATDALGWKLTTLLVDSADPQAYASAMKQAVNQKADYIVASGASADMYGDGLDAARTAGIPVIDEYSTDEPDGEANGIYANIGGTAYVQDEVGALADWVIADSKGKGTVAFVNIPDFPILKAAGEAVSTALATCENCTLVPIDATVADLTGGGIPQLVVSTLQSNPDVEYVYLSFGDLYSGLDSALEGAGLSDKVKVLTATLNPSQSALVASGEIAAGVPNPQRYASWVAVDAMLRLDQGMSIDQDEHTLLPVPIFTKETVPSPPGEWAGPEGYEAQFATLWSLDQ
jgi:ABC-type sugar transport system substrate-binding protein